MSVLTNSIIVSQSGKNVISILKGGSITDPQGTKRKADTAFIRSTRARAKVQYPHILVEAEIANEDTLSLQGDSTMNLIMVAIILTTSNNKDQDTIMDQIKEVMRSNRVAFKAFKMQRVKNLSGGVSPKQEGKDSNGKWIETTVTYFFKYFAT